MVEYKIMVNSEKYIVKPSSSPNKKYDVFKDNKKILSFGARDYQHYYDKLGHYSNLNHHNEQRRDNYRKRHQHTNINNVNSPAYWALRILW